MIDKWFDVRYGHYHIWYTKYIMFEWPIDEKPGFQFFFHKPAADDVIGKQGLQGETQTEGLLAGWTDGGKRSYGLQ